MGARGFAACSALSRLGRDDAADADDTFLLRCVRQERHRNIGLDVVNAHVAGRCAVGFKKSHDCRGKSLCDVDCHCYGLVATEWRVGGSGLRGELPGLYLLHDPVEIGVHVGVFGWVELAFNGREVLHATPITRPLRRLRRRRVGRLRLYDSIAACH